MKDEIKEILQTLDGIASGDWIQLLPKEANKLLDYITNLQEENNKLKENAEHNDKVVNKTKWNKMIYKSRCEKAIEFVKKESKICYTNKITDEPLKVIGNFMWHTDKLLNILQGEDKE